MLYAYVVLIFIASPSAYAFVASENQVYMEDFSYSCNMKNCLR